MRNITKTIQIKVPFTDAQIKELLQQISDADVVISEKNDELADLKEQEKALKEQIEGQHDIMSQLCAQYRLGSTLRNVECNVSYDKGIAKYTDVETGEVVDEHPITESEQLFLNEGKIIRDAEDLIREDTKKQD
jgi:hypothetical protein